MKRLGNGIENLADLSVQIADFDERIKSDAVLKLAKSQRDEGTLQDPMVRKSDKRLILGRDRVAGHHVNGWHVVNVIHVECTDLEADKMEIVENLRRRHCTTAQRDDMLVKLVLLNEAQALAENPPVDVRVDADPEFAQVAPRTQRANTRQPVAKLPTVAKGRPKGSIADTADQAGVSKRTVERAVAKAKPPTAKQVATPAATKLDEPAPPIELHGIAVPGDALTDIREITIAMDGAAAAVRRAMGLLKPLGARDNYPRDRYQQLYNELKFVSSLLRQGRPAWVCLDCKWVPDARANCPRCMSAGYIVEAQTEEIPEELKRGGDDAGIFVDGKFRKLSEIAA